MTMNENIPLAKENLKMRDLTNKMSVVSSLRWHKIDTRYPTASRKVGSAYLREL